MGKQIICQLELYTLVLVRSLYAQRLQGRRALFFIDNEAARFAVIKGGTDSPSLATMCRVLATLDQQHGSYNWVERVPSLSNPADAPSRGDAAEPARLFGAVVREWPAREAEDLAAAILEEHRSHWTSGLAPKATAAQSRCPR